MKLLDGFLVRRRVDALRSAGSLEPAAVAKLVDELAAMGPGALRPVSECLAHGEARGPALEVLARLVSDETLDEFLDLLASPNPAIVSGAAQVLKGSRSFTTKRLPPTLASGRIALATLEPILRAHAASIPAATLVEVLPALERDGQLVALRTLSLVGDPATVQRVATLAGDDDPSLRLLIVRFLAEHPGPGGASALAARLRDPERTIRYEAVKALHALGERSAVPALLVALEDGDPQVHGAATDALRVLADASIVPDLLSVLTSDSAAVRRAAVAVLDDVATPASIQALVRALHEQEPWVLVRAADALAALGAERLVAALDSVLAEGDDVDRRLAVEILNAAPDRAAVPTLIAALGDADWWVRERAIDALGKTGDERAIDPLLAQLGRGDRAAALCVRALGAIGHPRTLRDLGAHVDSSQPDVRREALHALAAFPRHAVPEADRAWLDATLARTEGSGTPSGIERPRSRVAAADLWGANAAAGASLLAPLPLSGLTPSGLRPSALGGPVAPPPPPRRDGATAPPLNFADLPEGQELLERYRIVRKIGRGGFGTVYLAHDAVIGEDIILKMLNPQLSVDDAAAKRFVQELKLARRVSHRAIIRIHDFVDFGGTRAISMEYFPGRDLGQVLAEHGPLDPGRALRIAAQVCDGLAAAHAEGVIHRDIKPGNILVGDHDEVRLVDFGLASAQMTVGDVERLTQSGLLIGTPEYMAPEQISGETSDHRVDLYSLGVVLYEVLSGVKPFTAETPVKVLFLHLEGGAVPLSERVPGLPAAVSELVAAAMARTLEDRPAHAADLRAAIDRAAATLGSGA